MIRFEGKDYSTIDNRLMSLELVKRGYTNAIMFALAEALILTAFGLFVAIPAVVAFNYFNRELKYVMNELNSKKNELILKKEK